jgi:hypothetical protein
MGDNRGFSLSRHTPAIEQSEHKKRKRDAVQMEATIPKCASDQVLTTHEKTTLAVAQLTDNSDSETEYILGCYTKLTDPFPHALRSKRTADPRVLWWHTPDSPLALDIEQSMKCVLVYSKQNERGMARSLPEWRLAKIHKLCDDTNVPLPLALSLRRHFIKDYNKYQRMCQLGLGSDADIQKSATIFECCVKQKLDACNIPYYNEDEQKKRYVSVQAQRLPYPPTPDFILQEQVLIQTFVDVRNVVLDSMLIGWIEAKMYYGASTIPQDGKSAVGTLQATARKYVKTFGPGAMIFMYGYGDQLAAVLKKEGVIALDGSKEINFEAVRTHQRTWCANAKRQILP